LSLPSNVDINSEYVHCARTVITVRLVGLPRYGTTLASLSSRARLFVVRIYFLSNQTRAV